MTELRWVLVLLGLAVVAGVYLWGRQRSSLPRREAHSGRVEPRLEDTPGWQEADRDEHLRVQPQRRKDANQSALITGDGEETFAGEPSRILVVHVCAAKGNSFSGDELITAMKGEGLRLNNRGVFESPSDSSEPFYIVANMVEPGTFPQDSGDTFTTQGITAFMILPGPGGVESLAAMIESARKIARTLGGNVLDETGSTLTNQGATHLREQVIEFQRRSQIGLSNE